MKKVCGLVLAILFTVSFARAQSAEVVIQLNEPFFDALLDAIFKNGSPPEYPLAFNSSEFQVPSSESFDSIFRSASFIQRTTDDGQRTNYQCRETIKLQREIDGVRTAVRFRDGQVSAPIAFAGNYNPPLVGCVDFSGVADAIINLEFDEGSQSLIGRARITNVNLSGTGGIGSGVIARLVQNSIDKKINPIQILQMEKISFVVPIQNGGNIRMKAVGMRAEVNNGFLNVRIMYEFQ